MLRLGIFGVGHLGKFHLNNWVEMPDVAIIGFYDPNDETAADVIEKYGIQRFLHAADLMDKIDMADIVAPTNFHFELCTMAIRKRQTCFC